MRSWSERYSFLIPVLLVAVAATTLLFRAVPETCTPQDPVRVRVADTVYAIPAVLLPHLFLDKGMVPVVRENTTKGKAGYSRAGSRLPRWYCESEGGLPISVRSFSVHDEAIANAVTLGELDYRLLPHAGVTMIRSGTYRAGRGAEDMAPASRPGLFRIHCGSPSIWNLRPSPLTTTYCSAGSIASSENVVVLSFYIQEREGQRTLNSREDWPEIAREVEHLIRSMQVPAE